MRPLLPLAALVIASLVPALAGEPEVQGTTQANLNGMKSNTNPKSCHNGRRRICIDCTGKEHFIGGHPSGRIIDSIVTCIDVQKIGVNQARVSHQQRTTEYTTTPAMSPMAASGGCCGGGGGGVGGFPTLSVNGETLGLRPLVFERIHRHREQAYRSNLGPGVFTNFDAQLDLTVVTKDGGKVKGLDYFDPQDPGAGTRFVEQLNGSGQGTGIFVDTITASAKQAQLFTSFDLLTGTGTPVAPGYAYQTATHAVITTHTGDRAVFQFFDPDTDPMPVHERSILGVPNTGASPVALPAGTVIAFGFYAELMSGTGFGSWVFDNVSLVAADGTTLRYREKFPLGFGQDGSGLGRDREDALKEGWIGRQGGVTAPWSQDQLAMIHAGGAADLTPDDLNNFPVNTGAGGCLVHPVSSNVNRPQVLYTSEFPTLTVAQVGSMTFQTKFGGTANVTKARVAVCVDGKWFVSSTQHGQGNPASFESKTQLFAGAVWFPVDIDVPSLNYQRAGRLVQLRDRNNFARTVTYVSQPGSGAQGDALWKIDRVTDAYGKQLIYRYLQLANGRHVVDKVTFPDGNFVTYQYDSTFLIGAVHPDGTTSSFTRTLDAAANLVRLGYTDAAAEPDKRRLTVTVTTNYAFQGSNGESLNYTLDSEWPLEPVACQLVRRIDNGAGEWIYGNLIQSDGKDHYVFHDGQRLALHKRSDARLQYALPWTVVDADGTLALSDVKRAAAPTQAVQYESKFAFVSLFPAGSATAIEQMLPTTAKDECDRQHGFLYDSANRVIQQTWPDTSTDQWIYHPTFSFPTRHIDRVGRVTTWTYNDVTGNLELTKRGQIMQSGVPTDTADTGSWRNTYNTSGAHNGLVATKEDANTRATIYAYDPSHRLESVTEPPDVAGGAVAVTQYRYDSAGRVDRITDPTGRQQTFLFDARGRVREVQTSHPAVGSFLATETFTYYGASESGGQFAGLLKDHKDRNGNKLRHEYDLAGRLIARKLFAAGVDPDGANPPVSRLETWQYVVGSTLVRASAVDGNPREQAFDHRLRTVRTTEHPTTTTPLVSTTTFNATNEVAVQTDPYLRRTQYVYDLLTGFPVRTVRDLIPNGATGTLETLVRKGVGNEVTIADRHNPAYVIEDCVYNAAYDKIKLVDGRGIVHQTDYDQQGRVKRQIASAGTFPASSNVTQIQGRLFRVSGGFIHADAA